MQNNNLNSYRNYFKTSKKLNRFACCKSGKKNDLSPYNSKFSPTSSKYGNSYTPSSIEDDVNDEVSVDSFRVYIVTWNVASKYSEKLSINELLGLRPKQTCNCKVADFYVIGLQEVNAQCCSDIKWDKKFTEVLHNLDFVLIKIEQLQGIVLFMYAKRHHLLYLDDVETQFVKTGFGGICGNKGGVSIRMTYRGCGIIFINSHLAAHDRELNERIADYRQILDNHHSHVNKYREIFDHCCVFWFGDLNFRMQYATDVTAERIIKKIKKNKLSELLERDQLNIVRNQGKAFYQMEESELTFQPTFKYEEGTNNYNLKRRPAWTDRILWRLQNEKLYNIKQLTYDSHPQYTLSDHKPVTSIFDIELKMADNQWYATKVIFSYIKAWYIGKENKIEINFPDNFKQNNSDWIGLYKKDFSNLSDYIGYEYTNQSGSAKIHIEDPNNPNSTKQITMPEKLHMVGGESYIAIYFSNNYQRGTTSIAGLSNPFEGTNWKEDENDDNKTNVSDNKPKV